MSKGDVKRYENFLRKLSKSRGSGAANAAHMIAYYAWKGLGDSRAIEPLINVLGNKGWKARMSAACALGALAANGVVDSRALEALSGVLIDKRPEVRVYAAAAVRRYAEQGVFSEEVFNRLVDLLSDKDKSVRGRALAAVRRYVENGFINEELTGKLIPLLKDKSPPRPPSVSIKAARAVAGGLLPEIAGIPGTIIADKKAQHLVKVLEGEELAVCGNAAYILGVLAEKGICNEEAVNPLIALLKDRNETNRNVAKSTLMKYAQKNILREKIHEALEKAR